MEFFVIRGGRIACVLFKSSVKIRQVIEPTFVANLGNRKLSSCLNWLYPSIVLVSIISVMG